MTTQTASTSSPTSSPTQSAPEQTVTQNAAAAQAAVRHLKTSALPDARVGCFAIWECPDTVVADCTLLKASFEQHLPEHADLVPSHASSPWVAAARAMRKGRRSLPKGYLLRDADRDGDILVIAYARESVDAKARTYAAQQEVMIAVHKQTGTVTFDPPLSQIAEREHRDALSAFVDRYQRELTFLTYADVYRICKTILVDRSMGMRVKKKGGMFLLPKPFDEVVERFSAAIAPAGMTAMRFPVLSADSMTVGQLRGPVKEGLLARAMKLRDAAEHKLSVATTGDKKQREGSLDKKLEEIKALRKQASTYKELMSVGIEDIEETLKLAQRAMDATLKAIASQP